MAGIGAEAAGGLSALQAQIRQRILDQLAERDRAFKQSLESRSADRADRTLTLQDQMRRDALAETTRQHTASESDRLFKENQTLNESIPAETVMSGTSPVAGRLQSIGALRPKGIDLAPPPMLAADPNASAEVPGTVENSPQTSGRLFRKNATQKQIDTNTDNARQADVASAGITAKTQALEQAATRLEQQGKLNEANVLLAQARAEAARATADAKAATTTTAKANGKQERARVNALAIELRDDTSLNQSVGPVQGRMASLRAKSLDFDNRIARLKALLSVEGRQGLKGQGAISNYESQLLERAMTSLDQRVDEKTFKAELQRIIDATGDGIAPVASHDTSGAKPTAAELIKKYGG